jgi:ABC-type antimicrobial peptide transport system permease subunit
MGRGSEQGGDDRGDSDMKHLSLQTHWHGGIRQFAQKPFLSSCQSVSPSIMELPVSLTLVHALLLYIPIIHISNLLSMLENCYSR